MNTHYEHSENKTRAAKRETAVPGARAIMQGRIRTWFVDKSYGFVRGQDGGDYFFHVTDLKRQDKQPLEGQGVSFEVLQTARGLRAANVELVGE
ncbi:MAG TPA: cold shock domain-containing protein, partial [Atribacteraceae bacterium]|nr:cold shock domain-containing protein [Atribacteraceae bacterium]